MFFQKERKKVNSEFSFGCITIFFPLLFCSRKIYLKVKFESLACSFFSSQHFPAFPGSQTFYRKRKIKYKNATNCNSKNLDELKILKKNFPPTPSQKNKKTKKWCSKPAFNRGKKNPNYKKK